MCKRNKLSADQPLRAADCLVTAAALLVLLFAPTPSSAGVAAGADEPSAQPTAQPSGTYQIRCWQHGRLLFEENRITLPADGGQYPLKVAGTDRNNKPIYVADTKNATCLIRSAVEERRWPR
jgi:hypothetical protein